MQETYHRRDPPASDLAVTSSRWRDGAARKAGSL